MKVLASLRQIAESGLTLDARADGMCFCVDPHRAWLAILLDHPCKGRCPSLVAGTTPQREDQIDGDEVVEQGDPLPRARLEACITFQPEFELVKVKRFCQLDAF